LIFRAPFPRLIRLILPFTYFFFYQFGVISRPYSLLMLGFVLTALFYRERNVRPWPFVMALALICLSSAYGLVMVAGIALVWTVELFGRSLTLTDLRSFLQKRQVHLLAGLLALGLVVIYLVWPYPDAHGARMLQLSPLPLRLFYLLLMAPGDACCSSSYYANANSIDLVLQPQIVGGLIFGPMIVAGLLIITRMYRKLTLLVVPYSLFAVFGSIVYFSTHHLGIIFLFFVFVLWCCYDERPESLELPQFLQKLIKTTADRRLVTRLGQVLLAVCLAISLYWSVASSVLDVGRNYGTGREISAFLKDNDLDDLKIMVDWFRYIDLKTGEYYDDYNMLQGVPELAYFDRNIFANFNGGSDITYLIHKIEKDPSAMQAALAGIKPDVLIGMPDLRKMYGSDVTLNDYQLVNIVHGNMIWKGEGYTYDTYIFLSKEYVAEHPGFEALNIMDY